MNGIRNLTQLVSLIEAECIDWDARTFDFAKCRSLIRVYMGLEKKA